MERSERLRKAINILRANGEIKTNEDVAKRMKSSASNVSRFQNPGNTPTESFLRRFNKAFGNIFDMNWLLRGGNEMFSATASITSPEEKNTIPRLPWKAMSSGSLRAYYAGPRRPECEERNIFELFPSYQFSLAVDTGDMAPYINVGDLIACNEVSMEYIIWGGVYLIDTEGGAMIRRVYESEAKGKIKLVAENDKYPDFLIEKKKVTAIYKIVGSVRVGI